MIVAVLCFGAMRDYLADPSAGRTELQIAAGGTVRDALGALGAPERLVHSVLVDGRRGDLDQKLYEGAEVTLMPPFAGGS